MLAVSTSDGVIRWMDVNDHLRRESREGKPLTQIVFQGERLAAEVGRRAGLGEAERLGPQVLVAEEALDALAVADQGAQLPGCRAGG
jgi:hypothetical protein